MKRIVVSSLVFCLLVCLPLLARALEVTEGVISTQISDRQPVDAVQSYPAAAGKLYCFTRIAGAVGETRIFHVWYREDQEMARVELPVKSPDWRTWSSKSLFPEWAGSWRVEVVDDEGKVLRSVAFNLL